MKTSNQYSLAELCKLVDLTPRTVRFYIQKQILSAPEGTGRAAFYHQQHLEQLLEIRKWQDAGLSLERIKELLNSNGDSKPIPPIKPKQPGDIEVCSHVHIADGLTLQIEPTKAGLNSDQMRQLISTVLSAYNNIKE
ncbi:MerR family transcriptional regulator [Parashewanella spongiae]|uniref:MerR family transcriptional regulator n=1 Tax=Parashewanella spongiae TaxID=342950 RepID=A0A3A6TFP1_9GAMM|nr:MerR family transcriptional regulator [Parashewanella spongiae]MCL1079682.1 MerR family transcriptional regulator [Parashewanella spongiae]RJY07047.1 MerR family transcriptional regulator [Parashewanella spongiae]